MARITQQSSIHTSGTSYENEPIIKSDGAGEVMQWIPSDGVVADGITIAEGGSAEDPLRLGIGVIAPVSPLTIRAAHLNPIGDLGTQSKYAIVINGSDTNDSGRGIAFGGDGTTDVGAAIVAIDTASAAVGDLAFYTKGASDGTTERMRIDSAGQVDIGSSWKFNANGSGTWGETSNAGGFSWDTGQAIIYALGSNYLSLKPSAADGITITNTGLATFANGIVETNGVLKSNLLTNSGFDVWSNSTLENVGSDLAVDGTFSDTANWTEQTGWEVTGGKAVATSAATDQQIYQAKTYVVGKLYRVIFEISGYSAGGIKWAGPSTDNKTYAANGTYTYVFESDAGAHNINFITTGTTTLDLEYVTLYEVTPGCVAATDKAFDGWLKDTANTGLDIWRHQEDPASKTYTKDGSFYSLKMSVNCGGTADSVIFPIYHDKDTWVNKLRGRTVTFGCWVRGAEATTARLAIYDGVAGTGGFHYSVNNGSTNWEWLEVTWTIATTAATVQFRLETMEDKTSYFSQPMVVLGSAIGSGNYSRPMGEVVNCEANIDVEISLTGLISTDDKVLNLEALSEGKIPKGAKSVYLNLVTKSSPITSFMGSSYKPTSGWSNDGGLNCFPQVASVYNTASGIVNCDSNGDIYQNITESGSNMLYNAVRVSQVHLR